MKILTQSTISKGLMCLLMLTATVTACKKDKKAEPEAIPTLELKATIDGSSYTVAENKITATRYEDSGDPKKAIEINAALDNNGNQLTFFINDLKDGTVSLAPKLGTSINPKAQPVAGIKGGVDQYYVRYVSGGNTFYAFKGTVEVKIVNNILTYTWNITFKDATAREFTSSGSFSIDLSKYAVKAKSEVKDPTPQSAKPTIENIAPNAGPAGTEVSITGVNYSTTLTENVVKFNGTDAIVKSATATKLVVTAPANGTTGPVSVKVKNSEIATGATFTYQSAPTILSVSPGAGKVGDAVTILGTGFSSVIAENVLKFNGTVATITSVTGGGMQATVPAGATTGPVTLSVNGSATVTGPQFQVNSSSGSGSSGVEYINALNGTATFSKLLTADNEIYTMYVDKSTNVLYYSDFNTISNPAGNTVYKIDLSGRTSTKFSADSRIKNVSAITSDAQGNIYMISTQDVFFQKVNVYKAAADGATVTEIAKDIALFGDSGRSIYVDSQGTIWVGHSDKIDITTGKLVYVSSHYANGAKDGPLFKGDKAYLTDYTIGSANAGFKTLDLVSGANASTDFTLQGMFTQDDSKISSNTDGPRLARFAIDNNENFYALYPLSYQTGQLATTWLIRKTKNGSGASTLISKFITKASSSPVYYGPEGILNVAPVIIADGTGNLYLKYNLKDIVKIAQ